MGEVAVLHRQDILKNQFSRKHRNNLIQPPMRSRKNPKNLVASSPNPSSTKVRRRKRSPANSRNSTKASSDDDSKSLIMEKVKILKRGQVLADVTTSLDDSLVIKKEENSEIAAKTVTEDLVVPTSKAISKQMDIYAGTGFVLSPPPSSLPLPAFCKKKSLDSKSNNFSGDFRRLLRLDLD
ncbi:Hypothetical predicted protein [Olea europaea subsp. europaea]|uniref:Uncharacterized protein n=1 Tax=Olea europaea subsp. europaea TaxID=158383 RepID=A0A8S0UNV4_OLEEU|nr:Hypothetical predicted protein [Olea europaea subsp. europaea]